MHRVYVSIGSNINRFHFIHFALDELDRRFSPLIISKVYDCEPIGFVGDSFLNLVVGFECDLSVAQLTNELRSIEAESGRTRIGPKFSARTLDIDILTYGDLVGVVDGVDLPRSEITENAFVLLPLVDVAGQEIHPKNLNSYQQLWNNYNQQSQQLVAVDFNWRGRNLS